MKLSTLVSAAVLASSAIVANAAPITFSGESTGPKSDGYTVGGISFSDSIGANLYVGDFNDQSHGRALLVGTDNDASKLEMSFANATSLSLDFGNDDHDYTHSGDRAWLKTYFGNTLVGTTSVVLNRDDHMNQTISLSGLGTFNNAVFYFGNSSGSAIGLSEIVDNINLGPAAVAAVPEPQTYAMLFAGLAAIGFVVRRRRRD
jgi:hypothetical protein